MNIAIDIRPLMTNQRTGVGEYTFELLSALFKNTDKNNQYFLFYNSYKDVSDNIPKWKYDNVHYVRTSIPNKLFSLFTWLGVIKLDRLISRNTKTQKHENNLSRPNVGTKTPKRPDDISLDYFFAPNLNFISLSKKTKFILTIHDLSFKLLPECYTWKQRLWHRVLRPKKLCRRADVILTPSENTKRDVVREWGVGGHKIKVLYPGLSSVISYQLSDSSYQTTDNSDFKSEDVKNKYGLPEKYILYLGAIEPRKNILGIIQAYKESSLLSDSYILLIAGASGWKNEEIFEVIKKTAGVKYIGYVDDQDKTALYKNASLFIFPSLYEGFGLPVLEALACGTPVITSNRSSLSEVFGKYTTLVNPNNIAEISGAMKRVLSGGRELPKADLKKFNWTVLAKIFLENL